MNDHPVNMHVHTKPDVKLMAGSGRTRYLQHPHKILIFVNPKLRDP